MSFCVVHFLNEDEVEVVPKRWIVGDRCYWPPYKNPERAIKSSESPSEEWNSYIIRILYERDTYEEARRKLKLAENASDLDNTTSSEKERGRGKRKRIPVNYSSESEVENDVHLDEQNIQCTMPPSLPMSCNSKTLDNEGGNDRYSTAGSDENESSQQLVHSSRKCDRQKLRNYSKPTENKRAEKSWGSKAFSPLSDVSINKENRRVPKSSFESLESVSRKLNELSSGNPELKFQRQILRDLQILKANQQQILITLECLLNSSSSFSNTIDESVLPPLPLTSLDEFDKLNVSILESKETRNNLVILLKNIDGNSVGDATRRMMRKLITNEVGMQFSWQGSRGKKGFSETTFPDIITDAVRRISKFDGVGNKEIESHIKDWLRHAKDRRPLNCL